MENVPVPSVPPTALLCPVCHLAVQPEFYFCPNCGKALKERPLSASGTTQAWIYALSIVMPMIAFLAIKYWPGIRYLKSQDTNTKWIGIVATALMAISTIVVFWLAMVWTQNIIQSSLNSIGNLSGLSG